MIDLRKKVKMAKIITGSPEKLQEVESLGREFGVKVSHKEGSDIAYVVKGRHQQKFIEALLSIDNISVLRD